MAGRIASASIRAVIGTKKPIKAALTLVSIRSKCYVLNLIITNILLMIIYYVYLFCADTISC